MLIKVTRLKIVVIMSKNELSKVLTFIKYVVTALLGYLTNSIVG